MLLHFKADCAITPITSAAAGAAVIMECGRSSGVEHNLAKVGVVGSNPIARSKFRNAQKPRKTAAFCMSGI